MYQINVKYHKYNIFFIFIYYLLLIQASIIHSVHFIPGKFPHQKYVYFSLSHTLSLTLSLFLLLQLHGAKMVLPLCEKDADRHNDEQEGCEQQEQTERLAARLHSSPAPLSPLQHAAPQTAAVH